MSRPLAFGYLVVRMGGPPPPTPRVPTLPTTPRTTTTAIRPTELGHFFDETAIARFAAREGFELVHVYRDHATDMITEPPRHGFHAMIDAVRVRDDLAAVIVVSSDHLGIDRTTQDEARLCIERHAGVALLTARVRVGTVPATHCATADRLV